MGGRGSLRGDRAWGKGGVAGGLEQGSWGLGRVSKGLGGWGLGPGEGRGAGVRGGGGRTLRGRPDGRSLVRTDVRKIHPCPIGHRPLRVRCPKKGEKKKNEEGKGEEKVENRAPNMSSWVSP